ncbi:hypothetical protein Hbor_13290 [Halogeometricum borinquense DSM 11551]|uniref:Uncharacterized protein n=1 Tax=Halogeometricum borinquense (strain ATCC 700274 / DSM 11551 / JCM 10706 / KCTC 4070 / PR3) TaxID=469382 RepID=E4NSC3_HALBP|nr:hypothetical protein Hbor_13290 [Halogeometricum borinquense DSM 11551]
MTQSATVDRPVMIRVLPDLFMRLFYLSWRGTRTLWIPSRPNNLRITTALKEASFTRRLELDSINREIKI